MKYQKFVENIKEYITDDEKFDNLLRMDDGALI